MSIDVLAAPQPGQISTEGGAYVSGSVDTGGGDFTGRDKIISIVNHFLQQASSAVEEAEKSRSLARLHFAEGVRDYTRRLHTVVAKNSATDSGDLYKGLLAYQLGDTEIFFGRGQAIRDLHRKLQTNSLTILHSQSGAGKTSLLQAGLAPQIIDHNHLPLYIRPYNVSPSLAIKRAFFPNFKELSDLDREPLRSFLQQVTTAFDFDVNLYILLDQFEEFFIFVNEADRRAFVGDLVDCLNDATLKVRWLLALRSEFFSDLARFRPEIDNPFANEYRLNRLTVEEARLVIMEPAARQDIRFEPELVERLLQELGDEKAEIAPPQLQLTCQALLAALLEQQAAKVGIPPLISRAMYDAQEGSAGILRGYLNQVLTRELPSKTERELARQLITGLVSSEKRRIRCKRSELVAGLANRNTNDERVNELLERLVKSRLLNVEKDIDTDEPSYELVHDYLLAEIELDPEAQAQKAAQELLAQEIVAFKRFGTLLSADKLKIIDSQQKYLRLDDPAKALLQRSKAQTMRRRVWGAVAFSLALVLASLAGLAELGRQNADDQSAITQSYRLASQALQLLVKDSVADINASLSALPSPATPQPYVAEAEFALTQGLHASLQRKFRQVAPSLSKGEQVAPGQDWIAVGGDTPQLIAYDLHSVAPLTGHTEPVKAVEWNNDNKTLLSSDKQRLLVWRDGKQIAEWTWGEGIVAARWQPNQQKIAICTGKTVQLWSYVDKVRRTVLDFPSLCKDVRWSPDGHWLVAWDEKVALTVWGSITDQPFPLKKSTDLEKTYRVAWSPDSRHLVAASGTASLYIWTVAQPDRATKMTAPTRGDDPVVIDGVKFIDNDRFVSFGLRDMARMWSSEGKPIAQFGSSQDFAQDVIVAPEQTQLLALSNQGSAALFDLASGQRMAEFRGHTKRILAAVWHRPYLATSSIDGTVRVWEIASGKEKIVLRGQLSKRSSDPVDVLGLRWLPDQTLLTYGADGAMRIWAVFDQQGLPLCDGVDGDGYPRCYNLSRTLLAQRAEFLSARWLGNDTIIATDKDPKARRISVATGETQVITPTSAEFSQVILEPTGRHVLFYKLNGNGEVQDFTKAKRPVEIGEPIASAFWLDADRLLISQETGETLLINPETGATLRSLVGHKTKVSAAQLATDGRLATAEDNGTLHSWDLNTGQELPPIGQNQPLEDQVAVDELYWSRDGAHLLAASRHVVLWDVASGKRIWTFPENKVLAAHAHASFSPDKQFIGVALDKKFFVLNADTGQMVSENVEHTEPILGIQWLVGDPWPYQEKHFALVGDLKRLVASGTWRASNARQLLLTWSGDGTARLWDWENRTEILRLGEPTPINMAMLNEAETSILTASHSGVLRVWQAWPHEPATLLTAAQDYIKPLPSP